MVNGYNGEILIIDLTNKSSRTESLAESDLKKYIGGGGLGAKYLFQLTDNKTDPLGHENVIIFMTGPFTGTKAFSSDRFEVVTKSPLTGIYSEANCGGNWGSALKRSGYDGIIIRGKSERPVFIYIKDKEVRIKSASDLWGLDTFDTYYKLKDEKGSKAEIACIGPAGEKLIKYSVIATNGEHARVAGRAGCGAVMGSKNLKAIVVDGSQSFDINEPEKLKDFIKSHAKEMVEGTKTLGEYGTSCGVEYCERMGDLPIRNWSQRRFSDAGKISGQAMAKEILKKRYYCGSCIIGCGRVVNIDNGKFKTDGLIGGPEYETIGMLGSNLMVNDIKAIAKLNELCNRYGLDTISTGSVIGMIIECYENGLIKDNELDEIDLKWGNVDSLIAIINKIGNCSGIGKLLGEGTKKISETLGSFSGEFAVQVKGLEAPAHDPRAKNSLALGYATSNRGACHLQSFTFDFEEGSALADLGYPETLDRFDIESKPEFVIRFQHLMGMFGSLSCCHFVIFGGITVDQLTETLNLITGFNISKEDFLKTGERIFNLKRLYNNNCGISRKDDILPPRFSTQKRGKGEFQDELPPLGEMLDKYYKLRGWSEIGIPEDKKIKELDLEEFLI